MRLPEARLWDAVHSKMMRIGDRLDRVENKLGDGIPDVNGCLAGEDVWIELKAPMKMPKRASTALMSCAGNHPLLQSQMNWFKRQKQAGGIAFILIRTANHLILIDGTEHGDYLNGWNIQEIITHAIYSCKVPTSKQDWQMLRNVIFTASRHRRLHRHASAQKLLNDLER